jgi:hypothetical protein
MRSRWRRHGRVDQSDEGDAQRLVGRRHDRYFSREPRRRSFSHRPIEQLDGHDNIVERPGEYGDRNRFTVGQRSRCESVGRPRQFLKVVCDHVDPLRPLAVFLRGRRAGREQSA